MDYVRSLVVLHSLVARGGSGNSTYFRVFRWDLLFGIGDRYASDRDAEPHGDELPALLH